MTSTSASLLAEIFSPEHVLWEVSSHDTFLQRYKGEDDVKETVVQTEGQVVHVPAHRARRLVRKSNSFHALVELNKIIVGTTQHLPLTGNYF